MSSRRLFTNAAANVMGFVAQVVVSFAMAPIVAAVLGNARYGVWSFAESVLAYLMLFDLGVASALVRFVPRMIANSDQAGLNRIFSACLAFFSAAAAIGGLGGGLFLYFFSDRFLDVPPQFVPEVRWVLLAFVVNFAAVLPLSVFPAMLDGLNAYSLKTLTRTVFLIARVPVTLWVIHGPTPLLGLVLVLSVSNVLESVVLAVLVVRQIPGLRFVPRQIDRPTMRMIRGFSIDSFLAMIAGRLTFSTDAFVIGWALGAAAIAPFAFANRLVDMARTMLRSTTVTLTPAISASEARGDLRAVRTYFLTGTRLVLYVVLPIEAGLLLLGKPFLAIWLRDTAVSADMAGPSLWVLAAPLALTIAQSVAARVLYGMGRIRLFARMALAEGVANLYLSLILVGPLGIVGVAWGTTIPHVIFCVVAIAHAAALLGIRPREYLRAWELPMALALLPTAVWLVRTWTTAPKSWSEFVFVGLLGVVPYSAVVAVIECRPQLAALTVRVHHGLTRLFGRHSAPR
jgi:O-antigen/teichoic acid export membrane protein